MPEFKRHFDSKGAVSHLEVRRETKVGKEWHPSDRVVQAGLAEGWLSIADGKMTLKTEAGKSDHVFKIVNPPGVFCSHCGVKLEAGGAFAQEHVAGEHGDAKSPDAENPAGYRQDNFFRLKRVK